MKSTIFTNAWKMVKELGITFSSALKVAWAEFKLSIYSKEWIDAQNNFQLEKIIDKKMAAAMQIVFSNKPAEVNYVKRDGLGRIVADTSGASYDYGFGLYNGD